MICVDLKLKCFFFKATNSDIDTMLDRVALKWALAMAGPCFTSNASAIAVQLGVVSAPATKSPFLYVKKEQVKPMNQPTNLPLASPSVSFMKHNQDLLQ